MSPLTIVSGPLAAAHLTLSRVPRAKLSKITISDAPIRTSSSAICEPIRPSPPVIRARLPRSVTAACSLLDMSHRSRESFPRLVRLPRADHPRRHTGDNREWRNVSCDDGAGADDAAAADGDTRQHDGVHADV